MYFEWRWQSDFGVSILVTTVKERERQLMTARANQTTGLTNGRAANWAPEVEFSPFRALYVVNWRSRPVAKSA